MPPKVRYTLSAFKRARFVGGGKLLVLAPDGDHTAAREAFAEAAEDVNNTMLDAEGDELYGRLNAPVPTPGGPALLVSECEPARALPMMLDQLAAGLEQRGISGTLRPMPRPKTALVFQNEAFPALGATFLISLPHDNSLVTHSPTTETAYARGWVVDPETTHSVLVPLITWMSEIPGQIRVSMAGVSFDLNPDGLLDFVTQALPAECILRLRTVEGDRTRSLNFEEYGGVTAAEYDPSRTRGDQHIDLVTLLRKVAHQVSQAVIKEVATPSSGRAAVFVHRAPRAPISEDLPHLGWELVHLEPDYVYDVCLTQVMTTSQLAKTYHLDLDRWDVEELGNDRHLVTHRQPDLWFETDTITALKDRTLIGQATATATAPTTYEPARTDFGDAIMTISTLLAHLPDAPEQIRQRILTQHTATPGSQTV